MNDWEEVVGFALTLPGTAIGSYYAALCPKVSGKAIVAPGREPGSFCLMVTMPEKEVLLETDPDTFWQTDHYRGYPAVLVRYGTDAGPRIRRFIERAWWDRAPRALRAAFGDRP